MDTNKPEPSMDGGESNPVPRQPPAEVSAVRRRLIKTSAFAPPVVLTLRSGAAMAEASAASCLLASQEAAQQEATKNPEFEATPVEDNFLRSPVTVREVRRIRKKNGRFRFWGKRISKVYTHRNAQGKTWLSLRPGRLGRKYRLMDTGQDAEVFDPRGSSLMLVGSLMFRQGYPRRRYVGIRQTEALGLVQTNHEGQVQLDSETGAPLVGAVVDPAETAQSQNVSASCWNSLGVSSNVQV